jgi:CO/xanthine dehydrogenase Mo-binding subunit
VWNKVIGNGMNVNGLAKPKSYKDYKIVGRGVKRADIVQKVNASEHFTAHIRPDDLLHARAIRPPVAGASVLSVDQSSISHINGAKAYVNGGFVAVVAPTEWGAVKASKALKVQWGNAVGPLKGGESQVFDYIRHAPITAANAIPMFGGKKDYDAAPTLKALSESSRLIEAEYQCSFQSHARISPSCGVADVKEHSAVVWSDTQKPHYLRDGLAKLLNMDPGQIHVKWMRGAGSYGRSDADEAPFEAALLSKEFKQPVRMQWSRMEGTAWDPKAPAAVISLKAGLDAQNNVTSWLFKAKGFNGWDVRFTAESPEHVLVGMQLGYKKWQAFNFNVPEESYAFPNHVHWWETVPPYLEQASPLRTAHMRAPQEMQSHFGQECFIDEVAHATQTDPVKFRLKFIKDEREAAVLEAAAKKIGWDQPLAQSSDPNVRVGRGIALHAGYQSYAAVACEVQVNLKTGRIWLSRVGIGHDCGLIVNPVGIQAALEGQVMQGISRALYEEVHFDEDKVTSVDWSTYKIASISDIPGEISVDLLNRPDKPIGGAGEPAIVCIPAAIANAVFNATKVRIRHYPMTPERVLKALA